MWAYVRQVTVPYHFRSLVTPHHKLPFPWARFPPSVNCSMLYHAFYMRGILSMFMMGEEGSSETSTYFHQSTRRSVQTDNQIHTHPNRLGSGVQIELFINPLPPELNPSSQRYLTRFLMGILVLEPCISLIYAWKTNKFNNYSFSLLNMYGSNYMFRH
jgi:hypothetical protein